MTGVYCIGKVKGHAEISRGQLEVKLNRNGLNPTNLVGRTLTMLTYCYLERNALLGLGRRSCGGQPVSSRNQIDWECCMATEFDRKHPWPECNALFRVEDHAGVIWGQPAVKWCFAVSTHRVDLGRVVGNWLPRLVVNFCRPKVEGHAEVKLP